jgi:hypothetical protein
MMQIVAIGLAAGACSALLFASVASGSLLSVFLFYAAALPLMIAGLGWSHLAALTGAVAAAIALGLTLDPFFFIAFLIAIGLPAWWLSYLTLLGRSVGTDPAGQSVMEWYPVGRLVLWAAGIATVFVLFALLQFGGDLASFQANVRSSLERLMRAQADLPPGAPLVIPGIENPDQLLGVIAAALPPTAAVLAMMTMLFNLYGAARVAAMSGRLKRPLSGFAAMAFPRLTGIAVALALAASTLAGLVGFAGTLVSATLIAAVTILGFATLHTISAGINGRGFVLTMTYLSVFLIGWPGLIVAILGLIELAFNLRARAAARSGGTPGGPTPT